MCCWTNYGANSPAYSVLVSGCHVSSCLYMGSSFQLNCMHLKQTVYCSVLHYRKNNCAKLAKVHVWKWPVLGQKHSGNVWGQTKAWIISKYINAMHFGVLRAALLSSSAHIPYGWSPGLSLTCSPLDLSLSLSDQTLKMYFSWVCESLVESFNL